MTELGRYGYQREKTGYSVWTLAPHTGDRVDCLAHVRSWRDARAMVERLYRRYYA